MGSVGTVGNAGKTPPPLAFAPRTGSLECVTDQGVSPVARIAYLSSDVILSVQPALNKDSEFSPSLHSLAAKKAPGVRAKDPEVGLPTLDLVS